MAYFYTAGEKKARPGVYQRISMRGTGPTAGALNGVVAYAMAADWGPVDKVTVHESAKSIRETYGTGASVDAACELITAGATLVYIKRLNGANGTAGTTGTADIETTVKLTAKYPSSRTITVTVKAKAGDATKKQVDVTEGTKLLETFEFAVSETDETDAFVEAVAGSGYITAKKLATGLITAGEYTLTGTAPVNTAADYADAFYALEPYSYNVLTTDSIEADVFALLCAYYVEALSTGKLIMVVGGTTPKTPFEERLSKATACNSANVIYFGSSWITSEGTTLEGAPAIARVAGTIAATPANKGIVHSVISGATDLTETLTNYQYSEAIKHGLLLLSVGPEGQIWFDSGINTLVSPSADQDDGWKKIRRVKTRYELMDRIDRTIAPRVGKINCDADGIAYIIQSAKAVIKEMIAEHKLTAGDIYEDPENPHAGDSAWFIIECDDIDSLEKIYLHYQFRYSAN